MSPGYTRRIGNYGRYTGIAPEIKHHGTHWTGNSIGDAGANFAQSLNLVVQGVNSGQRIGRKIMIKDLELRGQVTYQPTLGSDTFNRVRILIVHDKQCNGGPAAQWAEVFNANITGVKNIDSFRNQANISRFRVLKDTTFKLENQISGAVFFPAVGQSFNWKFKNINIPIDFSGTTAALTNVRSNNIFVLAVSSNFIFSPVDRPIFAAHTRISYSDV